MLAAMGVPEKTGTGAIRRNLGRETTDAKIDPVITQLMKTAVLLR